MKKYIKLIFLVIFAYILMEVVSFTIYSLNYREFFSFNSVKNLRDSVINSFNPQDLKLTQVRVPWNVTPHPYLGFGNPVPKGFDFLQNQKSEIQDDPNGIVVGITGGSLSFGMFNSSAELIKQKIEDIPFYKNKNVYMLQLGLFAWKQPQQLASLAYYLSLGGKLDILINLDGHNEVVDAGHNVGNKVHPSYPLLWIYLATNMLTIDRMAIISDITNINSKRYKTARLFDRVRLSVTVNTLWRFLDSYFEARLNRARIAFDEIDDKDIKEKPYYKYGPHYKYTHTQEAYEYFATIWKNSSVQMHRLAESNGIAYFHFLQPNQYVPNSKILSQEEMQKYYKPKRAGRGIISGYPLLQANGDELKKNGVNYYDLTMIFNDVNETLYSDTCCHLNKKGNDLLAKHIGQIIYEYYQN
jgi:hypothetical protein